MKRPRAARWKLSLPALACLSCASAAGPAPFVELEHRWVEASQAHDTSALDRLLDDGFVDTTFRGGVRTKRDVLDGPPAGGPYRSIRLDELRVRRYGGTAIVTGVNVLQGPAAGDVARVRFTDVFVERRGGWRAVSAQETLEALPRAPQAEGRWREATPVRRPRSRPGWTSPASSGRRSRTGSCRPG